VDISLRRGKVVVVSLVIMLLPLLVHSNIINNLVLNTTKPVLQPHPVLLYSLVYLILLPL
jgi:hypothetical protein